METNNHYQVAIVGAGPAGLTAALYIGRYRLTAVVFEKMAVGGQIILSPTIENYPGFPGGVDTQELISRFRKQVDDLGVAIENSDVTEIQEKILTGRPSFTVKTPDSSYECASLIIASGAFPKRLGIIGEERLTGRGVSYCGTCDGPFFKGKDIAVVGGGDRALEEALFLATYARSVVIIHRREEFRASRILVDRVRKTAAIRVLFNATIQEVQGESKVESLLLKNVATEAITRLVVHGVFIFVGIEPQTQWVRPLVRCDEAGFILTDEAMATSRAGIFAAGDCRKKQLYQVVTACSDGASAAYATHAYVRNHEVK